MMRTEDEVFGPVIYAYSRQQAINDGVLVDVTDIAKEEGFKVPVVLTQAVHSSISHISHHEDLRGRMHDLFQMMHFASKRASAPIDTIWFKVKWGGKVHALWAKCHGGDAGEPVITVMEQGED